jgi:Caspase domain
MKKVALLIGMSEYQPGLNPLPGAVRDMAAMQRVLQHSDMGGFDEVKTLANPDVQQMQEAIETLFSGCVKGDLTLLFFSGHGVKDDRGRLYFATSITRKNTNGDLVKSTAVPASFVQDIMSHARCNRQVVILDCCFSGAFAEGMTAKDDGVVDVQSQLGGEGRAVLTSSTSTQYSFEQQGAELSVYTRFIVEGIETGIADTDDDGFIAVDELHDYARKKVQATSPSMNPKIYAVEEGFRIFLAKAPTSDPRIIYRKDVERFASKGSISTIARNTLDERRKTLELLPEVAAAIEAEVMKPFQEYQAKLRRYEQVLAAELQQRQVLRNTTLSELRAFQEALGLRKEDADAIAQRLMPSVPDASPKATSDIRQPAPPHRETDRETRSRKTVWVMAAVVGLALVAGAGVRILSPSSESVSSGVPIESPAVSEREPPPEPSPVDPSPSPDPVVTPQQPAVWVVVVSSEKTLESAQEQVKVAENAGLSAMIFKRNKVIGTVGTQAVAIAIYAVQVEGEFATKAEAAKAKDYVLEKVPGWEKNQPFVRNQTDWCWQPVEQTGYVECQVKPSGEG